MVEDKDNNVKEIRLITVNACCLISGVTNKHLPIIFSAGGTIVGVSATTAVSIAIVRGTRLGDSDYAALHSCWLFALLVLPFGMIVGTILAGPFARFFALLYRAINRIMCCRDALNDKKKERMRALANIIKEGEYDVVCMQEMMGGYFDCVGYPDFVANLLDEVCGLAFVAKPGRPTFPSFCMNSGLLIASRWPIESFEPITFARQSLFEMWSVNRGALVAKLQLPNGGSCNVITCHVNPEMAHLARGKCMRMMGELVNPRPDQMREMCEIMARNTSKDVPSIIAGDFNIDIHHPLVKPIKVSADEPPSACYKDLEEGMRAHALDYLRDNLKKGNVWPPTYGYVLEKCLDGLSVPAAKTGWSAETLLTTKNQVPWVLQVTDDLVFSNVSGAVVRPKSLAVADDTARGFTHCSDHWGIEGVFPLGSFPGYGSTAQASVGDVALS